MLLSSLIFYFINRFDDRYAPSDNLTKFKLNTVSIPYTLVRNFSFVVFHMVPSPKPTKSLQGLSLTVMPTFDKLSDIHQVFSNLHLPASFLKDIVKLLVYFLGKQLRASVIACYALQYYQATELQLASNDLYKWLKSVQ